MVQSQFSLSWDSYKSNICNGFSSLQQNGEFVDMTLAADGHFVKVHQVLMALVSPYMKELINSAPCQHPVIFLNNVSYNTLCSLLEYVYTGEVLVPSENLMSFVDTAKALHIKGLEDLNNTGTGTTYKVVDNMAQVEDNLQCHMTGTKRIALPSETGSAGQVGLPAAAKRVIIKHKKPTNTMNMSKQLTNISMENDNNTYTDIMLDSTDMHNDTDDGMESNEFLDSKHADPSAQTSNLQFTVSIRGSLQVILNRYIYNLNSKTASGMRRWRCVDYRNHRCKAFIVTKNNIVLNRANLHNHSFHDKKILQKIEKKAVFSTLDDIKDYKEKELAAEKEAESSMDQDHYVTLELASLDDDSEDKSSKAWTLHSTFRKRSS